MPLTRRALAHLLAGPLAAAGVLAAASAIGPAAPAAAATTPCVGVVVDGRLAGGPLRTACAKGDPGSGLEALTAAGFSYAFVPRQPGLVCQVDGLPECSRTSTQTYWSYWHRAKGSHRWVYSTQGAGSYDPAPGSTEAWVWQDGGRREPPDIAFTTICPAASTGTASSGGGGTRPSSTRPTSARTAEPQDPPATGKPRRAGDAPTGSGRGTQASAPKPASTPSSPPSTATASPTPSAAATSTAPDSASPTAVPSSTARGADDESDSGGPPWVGLAVGAALVLGLGGAAVARARRGRSP